MSSVRPTTSPHVNYDTQIVVNLPSGFGTSGHYLRIR